MNKVFNNSIIWYLYIVPHLKLQSLSNPSVMPQIWLITGCSSGLGLNLALAALHAGNQVIATSRNPSKTPNLVAQVESLGGWWRTLDVSDSKSGTVVEELIKEFGGIDVLVNNAGVALIGAFEDMR